MKRTALAVLVLLCVVPAAASARPLAPADTAGIRATLDSLNAACARRDSAAFMALFDDAGTIALVGSDSGEVCVGRDAIAGFRRFLFRMPFTFSFDLASVTLGGDGHAGWAFVDGRMLHRSGSGRVTGRPYRYSVTMVKRGRSWKWQLFHGAVPGGE